jgi:hypothetical protein
MSTLDTLTLPQLKKAVSLRTKIDSLQNELNKLLGTTSTAAKPAKVGRRKMSAAGRAAISKAAKARWAKAKAAGKVKL